MKKFSCFVSIVFVLRNQADKIEEIILSAQSIIDPLVLDYELIVIDNSSADNSVSKLKSLTDINGIQNIQVFALVKEVSNDIALLVGLENSLGDFVVSINPMNDDINYLPKMLESAVDGHDVVFAANIDKDSYNLIYQFLHFIFNRLFKFFNGVLLTEEAPAYRLLNRKIMNFILQHPQPALAYRHLPATSGFSRIILQYSYKPKLKLKKNLLNSIDRGIKLLVSSTYMPMRIVTTLSIFGAVINILYSIYVVMVALYKPVVAEGWISLSLQQSGMFFLISVVLWVLGEYMVNMVSLSNKAPLYYLAQEFTSTRMTRHERLNIEEVRSEY